MSAAASAYQAAPAYRPPMEVVAWFLDRAPVPLREMAEALGLTVNMSAELPPDISGQIMHTRHADGDRYHIDVNGRDGEVRKRFTLAHEIAHFLLHREFLDNALTDDRMYRSRLGSQMERQANLLAAQLLMPANLVRLVWRAGARHISSLSRTFEVSREAMEIRLRELRLAP
ncbi:MAG: ImmA/IrrE family metallo-endopeptidase [Acetobacteraceae bacterium]